MTTVERPFGGLAGATDSGFQRVAWDLRYPAPALREHSDEADEDFPPATEQGPLILAGNYSVRMVSEGE